MHAKYQVTAPRTPGAAHSVEYATSLRTARSLARSYWGRRDLTHQDVRIEVAHLGKLVEYAGPPR